MGQFFRRRWRKWINQRIPRSDHRVFSQKNIFILPSGAGVVFLVLLLVMLITGINYQNSLIYLLTFLLGTLFVAAMHQTHGNLAGLELTVVSAGAGFPGSTVPITIRAEAGERGTASLRISFEDQVIEQHVEPGQSADFRLPLHTRRRGYLLPERIRVETRFPFGLLKAWSWIRPVTAAVVYPRPIEGQAQGSTVAGGNTEDQQKAPDGNDHADIRPWREGDLSQRVLWKRFARTGDMVVADWEGEQGDPQWLDYDAYPGTDRELRLSFLARDVLDRSSGQVPFGLKLPGDIIEPDRGPLHVERCLKALGVFGEVRPRSEEPLAHGSRAETDPSGETVV
jgi:uncharacterized protein (DUF58 family)